MLGLNFHRKTSVQRGVQVLKEDTAVGSCSSWTTEGGRRVGVVAGTMSGACIQNSEWEYDTGERSGLQKG